MIERIDITFANALEREIAKALQGEQGKSNGLYRSILGSQNWDAFVRSTGMILAYEDVLKMMHEVAQRMNSGEEPVRVPTPPLYNRGMN